MKEERKQRDGVGTGKKGRCEVVKLKQDKKEICNIA